MTDRISERDISALMAKVRSKDTRPEMVVRRLVHALGFRYRLHRKDLPGKPDLVFAKKKKIIFVHGCFWHGHDCPAGMNRPSSNTDYWKPKLERNAERDKKNRARLEGSGWDVLVIWECETKNHDTLADKILDFLS